jgi:ferredoxin-type protein NapH
MVYGNFLSFHMFGIPIADPLAVLQLSIKNLYFTLDNLIGALLPLLLAFSLGTVFCSWICPYGLLSELTQKLKKKFLPRGYKGLPLYCHGFTFKMAVFIIGFSGFFLLSTTPVLNQLSAAAWYSRFFQYYFGQDFVSLCFLFIFTLLLVEFVTGKRIWCRYICPQSVLIILTKLLNPKRLRVKFTEEKCICKPGYERCDMACTLHLHPKTLQNGIETECSNCGDCVVACKKMGKALSFDSFISSAWLPDPWKVVKTVTVMIVLAAFTYGGYLGYQKIDWPQPAVNAKATAIVTRYANDTYVLNLEVQDPKGLIKKVETSGKHVGMITMLTNVKKWINSPQIILSEGNEPELPFTTHMNIIFHDGHNEEITLETKSIVDKSSETFDDPWF